MRAASVPIGVRQPTSLCFGNDVFSLDMNEKSGPGLQRNMVSVLVLGWLYIFSAEMVERMQENSTLVYTNSRAELTSSDEAHGVIDVGDVNENAARWWAAILSPSEGWRATILKKGEDQFISPWSTTADGEQQAKVQKIKVKKLQEIMPSTVPPSSKQALGFLVNFCLLHGIQSQLFAALAVAITLPTHNCYGVPATLPSMTARSYIKLPVVEDLDAVELHEQIPYYMALSCNFHVVISSICGIFWEPRIPCNLVSPWLHPVLNEVHESFISSSSPSYTEVLCIICALRRPRLAALWLGAAFSGLAPFAIDLVRSGTPPLDPSASAWTGCPQSFLDIPGTGPYAKYTGSGTEITRADVWRLLYLPPAIDDDLHYESPPFSPWEPVGMTTFEDSATRVRVHRNCPRHPLLYCHWSWFQQNGSTTNDEGFKSNSVLMYPEQMDTITGIMFPCKPLPEQEASIMASCEVFGWVMRNCEGLPPESVYLDKWLQEEDGSETFESVNGSDTSDNDHCNSSAVDDNRVERSIREWLVGAE